MHLLAAALLALAPAAPVDTGETTTAAPAAVVDSAHWHASGTLSITDMSGNKTLSLFTSTVQVSRVGGRKLGVGLTVGARYGRSAGEMAVEDYTAGAELRFLPKGRVTPFVAATALRDDVKRIRVRLAASSGADLNLVRDSVRRVAVGLALLQDYERSGGDPTVPGAPDTSSSRTRFSMRLTSTIPVRPGVAIEHRTLFEPVASNVHDYLFTTQTSIRVLLTRRLALQTTYQFNRDTTPPEGVLFRNDRTLTVGVTVQTG
ncbi:MAG TPA: DUF481 domain-containing protein [Gemmatimonadales bacterium]|nr:DUF481 domain-containing protein [Gemmatimonadales bacterium]